MLKWWCALFKKQVKKVYSKLHKKKSQSAIYRKINQKYACVACFNMLTKIWQTHMNVQ